MSKAASILLGKRRSAGARLLTLTCTTTAPNQTLTLRRVTPAGASLTVLWGDGTTSTIANGNTGQTTHVYASAGTYTVRFTPANIITHLDLRDTKLSFNSAVLVNCPALTYLLLDAPAAGTIFSTADITALPLTYLSINLSTAGGTYTYNSAHLAGMSLSTVYVNLNAAGTYTHNSSHFASMPLTSVFFRFSQAGTYTINSSHIAGKSITTLTFNISAAGTYTFNSADIAGMNLTYQYISFTTAGTYTLNSSHIATMSGLTYLLWYFNTTGTISRSIARGDWDGLPVCATIDVEMGLTSASVDAILLGLDDGLGSKTITGGTVKLTGNGNAAPSGTYQQVCPPTTGREAVYNLLNVACNPTYKKYDSVAVA